MKGSAIPDWVIIIIYMIFMILSIRILIHQGLNLAYHIVWLITYFRRVRRLYKKHIYCKYLRKYLQDKPFLRKIVFFILRIDGNDPNYK